MPTVEDVILALAKSCDGARKRDGKGFSRSDTQDGKRLAAMLAQGISWSETDLARAMELCQGYAVQGARLLGEGSERENEQLEKDLRAGYIQIGKPVDPMQDGCNFAVLSPACNRLYFYFEAYTPIFSELRDNILELRKLHHGARRIRVELSDKVDYHINRRKRRLRRWEVTFNSTTQPALIKLCKEFGVALDPIALKPVDSLIDELLKHPRVLYFRTVTNQEKREASRWAVFDLDRKLDGFVEDIKHAFPAKDRVYDKSDATWLVPLNQNTYRDILDLADKYDMAVDPRANLKGRVRTVKEAGI